MKEETIYIYLLNEGTDVWRPVKGIQLRDKVYRIISENMYPEDEEWQFTTGDVVRCKLMALSKTDDYHDELVAIERIEDEDT